MPHERQSEVRERDTMWERPSEEREKLKGYFVNLHVCMHIPDRDPDMN
jgi:hypothetical protein